MPCVTALFAQLLKSGVAVEKLRSSEIRKNKIASGSSTNDFLNFLGILYPQNFGCLGGNWTFSTRTDVYTHNPVNECNRDFSPSIGYHAGIGLMKTTFYQLNDGWNAEPNAPGPAIEVRGEDLLLKFLVNPFQFPDFEEGEIGVLRFVQCERYRFGPTNDEGWYLGQCRFSKLAPKWGEFYMVRGDAALLEAPEDWQSVRPRGHGRHFLFYFRDDTFECVAEQCVIEPSTGNSLQRTGRALVARKLE